MEGYQIPASSNPERSVRKEWQLPPISIKAYQTPMSQVLLEIADQLGVSISLPAGAESETVTVDYHQANTRRVLTELANRLELVPRYQDGIFTFTKPDVDTHDFIVIRSGYIEPELMQATLQEQLGENASVDLLDDRIIITAPAEILTRASEIAEQATTGADGWMLEVKVITMTETLQSDLGLQWSAGGVAKLSANRLHSVFESDILIEVIANATKTDGGARLLDTATLHIVEGTTSTLNRGQRIPIPKFTTTIEGASTLTGFEYVNTGFTLEASAQRVPGGVRLNLNPTISSVVGFVREAPITQQSTMSADVILADGEWVILTGLDAFRDSQTTTGIPGIDLPVFHRETEERSMESIQILIRAHRVHRSQRT